MLFVDISVLRREYYGALKSKSLSLITLSSEYLQSVCSSFEQQHQQMVRAHFKDLAGKISEGQKHWEDYQKVVQTISDSKDWVRRGRECYQGVPDLKGSNSGHKVEAGRKATEEAVTAVENHMHEMEQVARNMKSLMWHKPEELASHLSNLPLRGAPTEEYELLVKKILEAIIPA
jgi:HPt (histidine-containing phosphotransfer) domain-containing protein